MVGLGLGLGLGLGDAGRLVVGAWRSAPDGLERWRRRSNTLGRYVRVGERQGLAEAIREDGALMVDGQPVLAGDVELLTPPSSESAC